MLEKIRTRDFIGYSSISLELDNIRQNLDDTLVPNINNNYTVTEKADGLRIFYFIINIS